MWPVALLLVGVVAAAPGAQSVLEVVEAVYRPDQPFAQFLPLWSEGWARRHAAGESLDAIQKTCPLGGYMHIYLRNNGDGALEVTDILVDGVSLSQALVLTAEEISGQSPASIHLADLPATQRDRLIAAGEPVWWKVEPRPIPSGGFGAVTIRLRRDPQAQSIPVVVQASSDSANARAERSPPGPRIVAITFSKTLDEVTIYVRHPQGCQATPDHCRIDGVDCTSTARGPSRPDAGSDTLPVVVRLEQPLAAGSFHLFEVGYPDGSTARAGLRAFTADFVYGMWGYTNAGKTPEEHARICLTDLSQHNINAHMGMGGDWGPFINSPAGLDFLQSIGMRMMVRWVGDTRDPLYYFLMDEPDANDYRVTALPVHQRLGALAQSLVRHSESLRVRDPATPQFLNVNNTYKPDNWYTYAQLPDVLATDPYYQEQLAMVYGERPGWLSHFVKPTCVYAAAVVCCAAAEPKPVHVILNAVRHDHKDRPFRFATPAEKRIELYYALAGGAKGISYWWYAPYDEYYGVGGSDPAAVALWTEIGLLGAEARTAGPLLVRSCPASVPLKAPPRLWVRTLLAGLDALLLIVVNDNYAVDRVGTTIFPVEKATVCVEPPVWLQPKDVFEITYAGTQPVSWSPGGDGLSLDLGTVELTRLIVISTDEKLRSELDRLYRTQFADQVARLRGQDKRTSAAP